MGGIRYSWSRDAKNAAQPKAPSINPREDRITKNGRQYSQVHLVQGIINARGCRSHDPPSLCLLEFPSFLLLFRAFITRKPIHTFYRSGPKSINQNQTDIHTYSPHTRVRSFKKKKKERQILYEMAKA